MKKLILFFVMLATISCSNDDQAESTDTSISNLSSSVFDGKMLSFKNDESFIKEYSEISEMKTSKDVQNWISKKGHPSLLNSFNKSDVDQDNIFDKSKIIYSDAIKAILDSNYKVKINGNVIWLSGNKFYKLSDKDFDIDSKDLELRKSELEVYGTFDNEIQSEKNITNKVVIPVTNGATVHYSNEADGKRYNSILFVESIGLGASRTVKLFLKSTCDYRSCSFWRCTWKSDGGLQRVVTINIPFDGTYCGWGGGGASGEVTYYVIGEQTILLATKYGENTGPCLAFKIELTGSIKTVGLNGYVWDLVL